MNEIVCLMAAVFLICSCGGDEPVPAPDPELGPGDENGKHTEAQIVIPKPDPNSKILYNGIALPGIWPPKNYTENVTKGMSPFYLNEKPSVIDVTIGRQLFVDDFLIAETTLSRKWHQADYYSSNPVLKPEKSWEITDDAGAGSAAPFSDGVWYDEKIGKFKMWYMAPGTESGKGYCAICYAESSDGIRWERPSLKVSPGTNIVYQGSERDSNSIWIDKNASNDAQRFKMFNVMGGSGDWHFHYFTSSDGLAWREQNESQKIADRSTVFFNPFRGVWVWSLRHNIRVDNNTLVRGRDYMENQDPALGNKNASPDLQDFWFGSWPEDPRHKVYKDVIPGTYNLDAIGYESILLGVFSVWSGPENEVCSANNVIKTNQLLLGYSRDGWNWYREDFTPFCPIDDANPEAWNHGNIQSAVGSPLIVGDKLYFYMSGRRLNSNNKEVISTGLATLRRDGFASMKGNGTLTTEPLKFTGQYFFVNADVKGNLKVEILDKNGNVMDGFSSSDCISITGDSTKKQVIWKAAKSLEQLAGKEIKVKFYLENGDLYSFWISQYEDGRSCGYTAGGGPSLNEYGIDL